MYEENGIAQAVHIHQLIFCIIIIFCDYPVLAVIVPAQGSESVRANNSFTLSAGVFLAHNMPGGIGIDDLGITFVNQRQVFVCAKVTDGFYKAIFCVCSIYPGMAFALGN